MLIQGQPHLSDRIFRRISSAYPVVNIEDMHIKYWCSQSSIEAAVPCSYWSVSREFCIMCRAHSLCCSSWICDQSLEPKGDNETHYSVDHFMVRKVSRFSKGRLRMHSHKINLRVSRLLIVQKKNPLTLVAVGQAFKLMYFRYFEWDQCRFLREFQPVIDCHDAQ